MLRVRNYSDDNDDARILIDPVLISLKLKPGEGDRCSLGHVSINSVMDPSSTEESSLSVYNLSEIKSAGGATRLAGSIFSAYNYRKQKSTHLIVSAIL